MAWSAGAVLTAAQLNTYVPQTWSAWTPTVTAQTGTFTTASGAGRYIQMGKTVLWTLRITITTAGTGSGFTRFTLPVTAASATGNIGSGISAGLSLTAALAASSQGQTARYDNATIIGDGAVLDLSGAYEGV